LHLAALHILRGTTATTLLLLNTAVMASTLLLLSLVRVLLPSRPLRDRLGRRMNGLLDDWVTLNGAWMRGLGVIQISADFELDESLDTERWYLIISNHQAWADILVLQDVLLRRVSPIKFFVKQPLIWLPFAGIGMWLLGFPFLRRYSKHKLEANPALRQHDREATLRACARFREYPTSALNFLEGTRFTQEKHDDQASPYRHLLKPKTGGIGYAIESLGERVHRLIDLTIIYPDGAPRFWAFLCGRCPRAHVEVRTSVLAPELIDAAANLDDGGRELLQDWINGLWQTKDHKLDQALQTFALDRAGSPAPADPAHNHPAETTTGQLRDNGHDQRH
jgi:1-acyl-sn-glycerol-3-phosphate acyltransferase